jgi:hypothetical protein
MTNFSSLVILPVRFAELVTCAMVMKSCSLQSFLWNVLQKTAKLATLENSPADSTNAAVNWQDHGTSRWQLCNHVTNEDGCLNRGVENGYDAHRVGAA